MRHAKIDRRGLAGLARALLLCSSLTAVFAPAPSQAAGEVETFLRLYTYCDAARLAVVWGQGLTAGRIKQAMGEKLLENRVQDVAGLMAQARSSGPPCTFADTGVSSNDAFRLSLFWRMTVPQAKARIAHAYTVGDWRQVQTTIQGLPR